MKYSFAQRLKKARMDAGLTQAELGRMYKKSINCIAQYECGNKHPTLTGIRTLMKILRVDANYFLV